MPPRQDRSSRRPRTPAEPPTEPVVESTPPPPPPTLDLPTPHPDEAREQKKTRTNVRLVFQAIGCEFATEHTTVKDGVESNWPSNTFWSPCRDPLRQKHLTGGPDLDCVLCAHVRVRYIGSEALIHENPNRHPSHGTVIPIPDEATADKALTYLIDELGLEPTRMPHVDQYYANQQAANDAAQQQQRDAYARRARAEAHQAGGRHPRAQRPGG